MRGCPGATLGGAGGAVKKTTPEPQIKRRRPRADRPDGGLPWTGVFGVATDRVLRILCPNLACQRVLAVPVIARGKLVRCRRCGMNIRIPLGKDEEGKNNPAPTREEGP